MWFLDLAVCTLQTTRIGRHTIHRAPQTAADLPALVPSHNRTDLHMVLIHRVHLVRTLVCRHELLRTLLNVLLLRTPRNALQATASHIDGHHVAAAHPDDRRMCN